MNTIAFPGLNLEFNISKIAITMGSIQIHWYAILIVLGFLLALLLFKKNDNKFGIKFWDIVELAIFVIPISLISARAYFVLFNLEYYISNPVQILNIRSRWFRFIWRNYWWSYNYIYFMQKKKNIFFRLSRLYSTRTSPADKQLAD